METVVDETREIVGTQYFRAQFVPSTLNKEERTVEVTFVTEREVTMWNWNIGLFREVLVCDDTSGDLGRLNSGAPLTDTHNTWSVRTTLGVVVPSTARFENGKGVATVRFSKRKDVDDVFNDVVDGIITGVSVGYNVYEYEIVENLIDKLPLYRATKWEGTEIALAPVQADVDSKIRSNDNSNNQKHPVRIISKISNNNMKTEAQPAGGAARTAEPTPAAQATPATAPVQAEPQTSPEGVRSVDDIRKEERVRASEIRKAIKIVGLSEDFANELIEGSMTLDQARSAIINKAAEGNTPEPAVQSGAGRVTKDETDKRRKGMELSLMNRCGKAKPEEAGEYRGMSLLRMAEECLVTNGVNVRGMVPREIAREALNIGERGGAMSTSDFPLILANTFNKTLRAQYELQEKTFLPWTRKSTATDFKEMMRAQFGDIKMKNVKEGGEYEMVSIGEGAEKYKVAKYGAIVPITWETIINDDLGAFDRIPTLMSGAVAQMQSDIVYGIITNSHIMSDTKELFHSTHGNLAASGTAIDITNLGKGRAAMRKQKSLGDNFLNIAPKYLLVGPDKEQEALQMCSTNYTANTQGQINVWSGLLTPIVEARITGNTWYLAANPQSIDTVEWAVLDGEEIFTEWKTGFEVDGLMLKGRSVFGAKAIDFRSMYKNPGA